MTCDERLEQLLNRAGQTISDLPKRYEQTARSGAFDAADQFGGSLSMTQNFEDYILHLTDVIDRLEWALENLLNLKDRHVHIVSNVDAPEGLTQEQYFTAAEAIIDATDKYRAGLEPWDDWRADDA